ncbi:MAG: FtsW/RodA/SpoVE family cell cycle protein [Puniceicoccaceae bacterium]
MAGEREIVWDEGGDAFPSSRWLILAVLVVVGLLTSLGLTILFSASSTMYEDSTYLLSRQVKWLFVAGIACLAFTFIPLSWMERLSPYIFLGGILGLLLVLIPGVGVEVKGAQRWIDLGGQRVQPSEFAKIGLVFGAAFWFSRFVRLNRTFVIGFLIPSIGLAVVAGLIFKQPDYGTAALCGLTGYVLFFFAGARLKFLLPAVIMGAVFLSVMIYHDPVRRARVTSYLHAEETRNDGGYQLWQSVVGLGTGGLTGSGLGNGRQQNEYLPEAHTDFIFAVVGEELGLLATSLVVLLFGLLFFFGIQQLRKAPNLFEAIVFAGALLFITFQSLINLGVVTGILPTKGMSLPFISYGGSNLVTVYIFLGILLNCFRTWDRPPLQRARFL